MNGIINFLWVKSKLNRADIGTKALQGSQFQLLADQTFSRVNQLPDEFSEECPEEMSEEEI